MKAIAFMNMATPTHGSWKKYQRLKPRLVQTMSLGEAREAQELSETGGTHGKVILKGRELGAGSKKEVA